MNNLEKQISSLILHKTDWIPLALIPSVPSRKMIPQNSVAFWRALTSLQESEWCGVYQVSMEKPSCILDPKIGYIGSSDYFPYRVYNLKCSTTSKKNRHHQCGRYLHHENVDANNVYVRMLYTHQRDVGTVEKRMHEAMRQLHSYSYGFMWEQASGGPASSTIGALDSIARIDTLEDLEKIEQFVKAHRTKLEAVLL